MCPPRHHVHSRLPSRLPSRIYIIFEDVDTDNCYFHMEADSLAEEMDSITLYGKVLLYFVGMYIQHVWWVKCGNL
jgi:hypothetical protein